MKKPIPESISAQSYYTQEQINEFHEAKLL